MNKKAQIEVVPEPYKGVNPVLIIGIIVFCIPFFNYFLPFKVPGFVGAIGLFLILIGAGIAIYKASQ